MDYNKSQFCKKKQKKIENVKPFQNGGQITDFYFASFQFWPRFEKKKNTFPKEFFNEFWLKVGEHKCIYITKITFKKKYPVLKWRSRQFLILRNNANLC